MLLLYFPFCFCSSISNFVLCLRFVFILYILYSSLCCYLLSLTLYCTLLYSLMFQGEGAESPTARSARRSHAQVLHTDRGYHGDTVRNNIPCQTTAHLTLKNTENKKEEQT